MTKPLSETHKTLFDAISVNNFEMPETGWVIPQAMIQKYTVDRADHDRIIAESWRVGRKSGLADGKNDALRRVREVLRIHKFCTSPDCCFNNHEQMLLREFSGGEVKEE